MANLTLTRMLFANAVQVANGSGDTNLLTPDPKEVWVNTATGSVWLDMGSAISVDTFFLGFVGSGITAATAGTAASLGGAITNQGSLVLAPTSEPRRHGHLKLGAPVSSRYFSFSVTGAGSVGIAAVGKAVQPSFGHEWGSGRQPVDLSSVTPLRQGGFAVEKGAIKGSWSFTLGDLTDQDLKDLWDVALNIGISSPVLACEDPALTGADLNKALHYGLLDRPEVYERQLPGLNRWSWRVEEWV